MDLGGDWLQGLYKSLVEYGVSSFKKGAHNDMSSSRRDFLKRSAVVYTLVESASKLKAAPANDQIGLGFIGVGIRGMEHFNAFRDIPGARLVAAADLYDGHLTRAKELAKGELFTTKEYEAVLNRKDVDAVVIATPDHWHRKMTLDALAA